MWVEVETQSQTKELINMNQVERVDRNKLIFKDYLTLFMADGEYERLKKLLLRETKNE